MKHAKTLLAGAILLLVAAMPSMARAQYHEQRLDRFLDQHQNIKADLMRNPSLIYDRRFRHEHPELEEFMQNHPNVWGKLPNYRRWGDYDERHEWHDADWWHENHPDWIASNHPDWMQDHPDWRGRGEGDYDERHVWHDRDWWNDHHPDWVQAHHPDWYKQHGQKRVGEKNEFESVPQSSVPQSNEHKHGHHGDHGDHDNH